MKKFFFLIVLSCLAINFLPPLKAQEEIDYDALNTKIEKLLAKQDETLKKLDEIAKEIRKIKIRVSRIRR